MSQLGPNQIAKIARSTSYSQAGSTFVTATPLIQQDLTFMADTEIEKSTEHPFMSSSLAPWLSVRDSRRAVGFYKSALAAVETYRLEDSDGGVVAKLSVNGAEFWVSEESPTNPGPQSLGGGSVRLILTVTNPDTVFAQALQAGGSQVFPVSEEHGWRVGRLVDPFGHHWEIGCPGLLLPENKFSLVQLSRWILGIILSGVLTLGIAGLVMHHGAPVDMTKLSWFQYWVVFLVLPSMAFGLFVFLCCLLVPFKKRSAGILAIILSLLFISYGVYQHYSDDGFLANQYIIRYTGFVTGVVLGFWISCTVFDLRRRMYYSKKQR
ncbi:VOC family protein [Spirosoma areae]